MTPSDHGIAAALVRGAGELLLRVRNRDFADAAARKAAGDAEAHRYLTDRLAPHRPEDAVLSEEGADEPGRTDWAVHVALWERGDLVAGAVALPAEATTLSTADVAPAPSRADGPMRLAVSRSRPPVFVTDLAERLGAELLPMGSAGVKAMSVVRGIADAYVHGGGQYEWDSAAPVAVARAAGLHASRLDGSALQYNQPNPYLPDLLICRPELHGRLLAALADR